MGTYNRLHLTCPKCETHNEFQSKGSSCEQLDFSLNNAPYEDLNNCVNDDSICKICGTIYRLCKSEQRDAGSFMTLFYT